MIVRATRENVEYVLFENEPFNVIGRLLPCFENGVWTHAEQLFDAPYQNTYEDDFSLEDTVKFLEKGGRALFLYMDGNTCLGKIRLRANWNRYAFIEDITVRACARGKGVGTALFETAKAWAREEGLLGLTLETQDMNLLACRFYQKAGMELGAADNRLYANFPETKHELALFWYMRF